VPTGTATFADGNPADTRTVALVGGQATADFTGLPSGTAVTINVTYNGDNNFFTSSGSAGATPNIAQRQPGTSALAPVRNAATSSSALSAATRTSSRLSASRVDQFFTSTSPRDVPRPLAGALKRWLKSEDWLRD
jgi:hypothetical protein